MARSILTSWGLRRAESEIVSMPDRFSALPEHEGSILPFGNGRSYGDVGLNDGGTALLTRGLDHFMAFDDVEGVLTCESGVLLGDILQSIVPRGWFLPVMPGTRFVTLGGAIANDVHGKNHHAAGSFGCHVRRFELLRSDGRRIICSPSENAGLFAATIGGLGLTGLIVWAEIALKKIASPWMETSAEPFSSLDDFIARHSAADEYTVAWIDCTKGRAGQGGGVFLRGRHAEEGGGAFRPLSVSVPFTPPFSLVNSLTTRAVNALYRRRKGAARRHYRPFFFPLDAVQGWNRLYGPRGFYQYQCVVPDIAPVQEILNEVDKSGLHSFLATLKMFGTATSPGLLSFPRAGASFSIDLADKGAETLPFLTRLDDIVRAAGGRLYPAKDARMSGAMFRAGYPRWQEFTQHIDPRFSSGFWRRVTEDA